MSGPEPALRVVVIGLGNTLRGDDGAGLAVVRLLREQLRTDDPAERWPGLQLSLVEAGRPGFTLPDLLEGADVALIVDAVLAGTQPGTVRRLDGRKLAATAAARGRRRRRVDYVSSHGADLAASLALAEMLFPERLPRTLIVWGVEPETVRFGTCLSPRVAAALPTLVARLCEELDAILRGRARYVSSQPFPTADQASVS